MEAVYSLGLGLFLPWSGLSGPALEQEHGQGAVPVTQASMAPCLPSVAASTEGRPLVAQCAALAGTPGHMCQPWDPDGGVVCGQKAKHCPGALPSSLHYW